MESLDDMPVTEEASESPAGGKRKNKWFCGQTVHSCSKFLNPKFHPLTHYEEWDKSRVNSPSHRLERGKFKPYSIPQRNLHNFSLLLD